MPKNSPRIFCLPESRSDLKQPLPQFPNLPASDCVSLWVFTGSFHLPSTPSSIHMVGRNKIFTVFIYS